MFNCYVTNTKNYLTLINWWSAQIVKLLTCFPKTRHSLKHLVTFWWESLSFNTQKGLIIQFQQCSCLTATVMSFINSNKRSQLRSCITLARLIFSNIILLNIYPINFYWSFWEMVLQPTEYKEVRKHREWTARS